jgi:hypothetical protein
MPTDAQRLSTEANRLYWDTDSSVADIADGLSVSRRALYTLITPQELAERCSSCGGTLTFTNRLRRASGHAECAGCGRSQTIAALREETADKGSRMRSAARPDAPGSGPRARGASASGPRPARRPLLSAEAIERNRSVLLGGAALAGLAIGAIATMLLTGRD